MGPNQSSSINPEDKNLNLMEEASLITAISKVLDNQSVYNHIIEEMLKMITRIAGWILLTLVNLLYN